MNAHTPILADIFADMARIFSPPVVIPVLPPIDEIARLDAEMEAEADGGGP